MIAFWHDLVLAARTLARRPGLAVVTSLTLALGIGANTTVFSWIKAILLDPLPGVADADRLVVVRGLSPREGPINLSYPDYVDLRDRAHTLGGLAAHYPRAVAVGESAQVERAWAELASGNFFAVLGVRPAAGRFFLADEDTPGAGKPVAVISHALWERQFAGQASAIGGTLKVNNQPYTVIGVAPPGFGGGYTALAFDLWLPMAMQPQIVEGGSTLEQRGSRWLDTLGRLAPGATAEQARAELSAVMSGLAAEFPESADATAAVAWPLRDDQLGPQGELGPVLGALIALSGLVLLITCANVANLLLVRAAGRRRELALRLSLGAGRWRLARLLLAETLVLACLGAALALVATPWTARLLSSIISTIDFPIALNLGLDVRVLAFAASLAVGTAALAALAPVREAVRTDLSADFKEASGTVTGSRRWGRWRDAGLLLQAALSTILLVAAALFIRSLGAARRADPGFNPRGLLLASIDFFPSGIAADEGAALHTTLLERLGALPGVQAATLASDVPFFLGSSSSGIEVPGFQPAPDDRAWTFTHRVGPDYFRTMQVPIEQGRELGPDDTKGTPPVVVVSRTFANRYLGGREPIGHEVVMGNRTMRIVGVAREFKHSGLTEPSSPHLFVPLLQDYQPAVTIHLRAAGDPMRLAPEVRRVVRELAPGAPVFNVRTLGTGGFVQRLGASLLSALGCLVLVIAGVGLYGLLAFGARTRVRELGIRLALGSRRWQIARLVVGRGLAIAGCGLALGLVLSLAVGRLLASVLFGVSAADPVSFVGAAAALLGVATLACIGPALRVMAVQPSEALRYE